MGIKDLFFKNISANNLKNSVIIYLFLGITSNVQIKNSKFICKIQKVNSFISCFYVNLFQKAEIENVSF